MQAAILEVREARRKKEEVVEPKNIDYPAGPRERPAEHTDVMELLEMKYFIVWLHWVFLEQQESS